MGVVGRRAGRLEVVVELEVHAHESWLRDIALRGIDAQRGMHIVTITTSGNRNMPYDFMCSVSQANFAFVRREKCP